MGGKQGGIKEGSTVLRCLKLEDEGRERVWTWLHSGCLWPQCECLLTPRQGRLGLREKHMGSEDVERGCIDNTHVRSAVMKYKGSSNETIFSIQCSLFVSLTIT